MSKVWFTADLHLGHARIIELANRPFSSVEEMDETLIARWNERVARGDRVFVVGDFAFDSNMKYLPRLNGQKSLVLGNHDHRYRWLEAQGRSEWLTVESLKHLTVEETKIALCHYALRVWAGSHHGAIHLYGHSHGNLPGDSQSCDVGVDCWDFRPVSLDEIKARLATLPKRFEPDHHQPREAQQ